MEPVGAFNLILLLGGFFFVMFMVSVNKKDAEKRENRRQAKEVGMRDPYLPAISPQTDIQPWSQPIGSYGYPVVSSPESQLAVTNAHLAARLLERQSLDETHVSVAGPVALELARQGNTDITVTTYRTTSFFGNSGVVTRIKARRR